MTRHRDSRGQALVEFALVVPIFVLLLVAIFDLGHVVWANDAISNAAREAARYAIVHGGSDSTACPVGPAAQTAVVTPSEDCPFPSPSREAIKEVARQWLIAVGPDVSVSVCYGSMSACSADIDAAGATNARGTPVTVTVEATVSLGAPSVLGMGPFDLSSSSTMVVSH